MSAQPSPEAKAGPASGDALTQRTLVAFQDPKINRFVERTLQQAGFEVISANDGQEALDRSRSEILDLVVLDTTLPPIDGFEVVLRMKADPNTADIPIILIRTSKGDYLADVLRKSVAGADCLLLGPVNPKELVLFARRICDATASRAREDP
jgi:DNA-binding response OmpR family regulator